MDLVPFMYWESQEPGSQLCAQHCLNNLLQQHTYNEFDLAEIANRLDQAENATLSDTNKNRKSYNFNDTGFFSISVLEHALQVWDLTLVRWRGEAMKPYQEHPEDQVAFILNLSSHWIPLRRFAPALNTAVSTKRWYNLNSFLPQPEWISPTYLRMVLTQAEQEGYSVFVVRKGNSQQSNEGESQDAGEGHGWGDGGVAVFPECQADLFALQLGEPVGRSGGMLNTSGGPTAGSSRSAPLNPDQPSVDPSSITPPAGPSSPPSRRLKHQEGPSGPSSPSGPGATVPAGRPARQRQRGGMVVDEDDEEIDEVNAEGRGGAGEDDEFEAGPTDFVYHSRDYDDEDAAFQAALRASMEDVPQGWVAPDLKPQVPPPMRKSSSTDQKPLEIPIQASGQNAADAMAAVQSPTENKSDVAAGSKPKSEVEEVEDDTPAEAISADEIRRRRLAKFGS